MSDGAPHAVLCNGLALRSRWRIYKPLDCRAKSMALCDWIGNGARSDLQSYGTTAERCKSVMNCLKLPQIDHISGVLPLPGIQPPKLQGLSSTNPKTMHVFQICYWQRTTSVCTIVES